jgi:hypothetical protein
MKPWLEITQSDALIVQPSQPVSDQSPIARKRIRNSDITLPSSSNGLSPDVAVSYSFSISTLILHTGCYSKSEKKENVLFNTQS